MRLSTLFLALALALPTVAQAEDFSIGRARPGMRLNEFRYSAHPAGVKVVCTHDVDRPPGVLDTQLALPKQYRYAKAFRCALFGEGTDGKWTPRTITLAGAPAEFWLMATQDEAGTDRIVQLVVKQPPDRFESTLAELSARFGRPARADSSSTHWLTDKVAAFVATNGTDTQVFIADTKLQAAMQGRLDGLTRRK